MTPTITKERAQQILDGLPDLYRGPGGAVAVLKDGELLSEKVWGFANLDDRIPMTPDTIVPICSISKQMVCALLYVLNGNKYADIRRSLADRLGDVVPAELLRDGNLTIDHLAHNQSGIRDYWALSALWGTKPEDPFTLDAHAVLARQRLKSFQFEPGTEFSYCNTNYHILGRLLESVTGEPLETLLASHIFRPAGMETAVLFPDTAKQPVQQQQSSAAHHPMATGYEGTEATGYTAAVNRINWSGDAGILASLRDMIAYEKYLDGSLEHSQSWYNLARGDGSLIYPAAAGASNPVSYQNGLARVDVGGVATIGHGGALRGWRLYRLQAPEQRISVVVLFNHEADSFGAAAHVLRRMLDLPDDPEPAAPAAPEWDGVFLDQETMLAVTMSRSEGGGGRGRGGVEKGKLTMRYGPAPDTLKVADEQGQRAQAGAASWARIRGDHLEVWRAKDNRMLSATRIGPLAAPKDKDDGADAVAYRNRRMQSAKQAVGTYRCDEIDSTFHCFAAGDGILYGAFDGFMGKGPVNLLRYLGEDVWAFACPRGLDAKPPGDWTMCFTPSGVMVGCWLARKLEYRRI